MIRAIVKNGLIQPLQPLPANWKDGSEVEVREMDDEVVIAEMDWDEWLGRANELASRIDPEDLKRMHIALEEADTIAKDQMRREMGLS